MKNSVLFFLMLCTLTLDCGCSEISGIADTSRGSFDYSKIAIIDFNIDNNKVTPIKSVVAYGYYQKKDQDYYGDFKGKIVSTNDSVIQEFGIWDPRISLYDVPIRDDHGNVIDNKGGTKYSDNTNFTLIIPLTKDSYEFRLYGNKSSLLASVNLTSPLNEFCKSHSQDPDCAEGMSFAFKAWGKFLPLESHGEIYFIKYLSGYLNDENKISTAESPSEILIDSSEKQDMKAGTILRLKENYELSIKQIKYDTVYVELTKNGQVVDSKVVEPFEEGPGDLKYKTYYYKIDTGLSTSKIVIAIHFDTRFEFTPVGTVSRIIIVDGMWQISENASW